MTTPILSDSIRAVITNALDSLYANGVDGGLGKTCRLVYPPRMVNCPNCKFDPTTGKSANVWKTGGPMEFSSGTICPMCSGKGKDAQEVSEEVTFLCSWEPRHFFMPMPGIKLRVPFGILQTKGFVNPWLPKVLKCDHMIFQTPLEPYLRLTYKLVGNPGDMSNIIQNRYFVAVWELKG